MSVQLTAAAGGGVASLATNGVGANGAKVRNHTTYSHYLQQFYEGLVPADVCLTVFYYKMFACQPMHACMHA